MQNKNTIFKDSLTSQFCMFFFDKCMFRFEPYPIHIGKQGLQPLVRKITL